MDTAALVGGILIGVVVGFLVSYPVGFLRELGRDRASRLVQRRADKRLHQQAEADAAKARKDAEAQAERERQRLERIRTERVGRRFMRRETRADPGIGVEVVDLDPRQPQDRVIVRYTATAGRSPTRYDPPSDTVSIEWKILTQSPSEQRHRTARLIEQSFDDNDGWLQFEPARCSRTP